MEPRGFKIKKEQARREGYDAKTVHGSISYDPEFNGCPYCGANGFYICSRCGKIVCYNGEEYVTCPNCGTGYREGHAAANFIEKYGYCSYCNGKDWG